MTLADEINRMIRTMLEGTRFSSAGDANRPINTAVEFTSEDTPDLEQFIRDGESGSIEEIQAQIAQQDINKKVTAFDRGNVGEVNRFTREQFGNIRGFAQNPVGFMINSVFGKFAKGAGVAALALTFFEVVKFIINELLKPGRFLDRRFRRDINREILAFREREEKQKLLVGKSSIIVTTIGGLRGGEGQISSNLRALGGLQAQPIPTSLVQPNIQSQASGQDLSVSKGRRGRFRQ